ncbi:MAG: MopE-related protein [Polyangiales bacterium]
MLRHTGLLALLAATWLSASASVHAQAQIQVKPWFLVIVDTSGSMTTCTNGATDRPTCVNCGNGTPCSSTTNTCGMPRTRIHDAKCALRNILNSTGDAEFGLMQFRHPCSTTCANGSGAGDTSVTCNADVLVNMTPDNYKLLPWVDGQCTGSCANNSMAGELYTLGSTPLEKSLRAAKTYFSDVSTSPIRTDAYAGCRPVAAILLTDGEEACGGTPANAATDMLTTAVTMPNGMSRNFTIKTYTVGFGITPGNSRIEAIATAGGTDAPGQYRSFYAQNEETLSAALNQIIIDSQLSERCDGVDNDCDARIDEDNPKYCDVRGLRTQNPRVPSASNPNNQVEQPNVIPTYACSGATCPPVPGQENLNACAAPEWSQSSTCSPNNLLCTSPGERCDGQDDDCDGKVDEGAPTSGTEVCGDARDNDCDGNVDENCNGCISQPEICNEADDDCDGNIDENVKRPCGTDVGECTVGEESCVGGEWVDCTAQGGVPEQCNNLDDDCDGVIDGNTRACGSNSTGVCRPGINTCIAGTWSSGCTGAVDPGAEVCDNLDNDCDGSLTDDGADDPRVNKACGSNVGVCRPGTTICDQGEIRCQGATLAGTEVCDGLDNDCDNNIDEGVAATDSRINQNCVLQGTDVVYGPVSVQGQCQLGKVVCSGGELSCPGYVGPTLELCDALDQDCDGNPVNGVAMTDPRVGASCGTSVGECRPGQIVCQNNMLTCNAVGGTPEICDGKDNNCNGLTDDLPASQTECYSGPNNTAGTGECKRGREACIGGGTVCEGQVTPSPEACDGKDNDCDGTTDEQVNGIGRECGSQIGLCTPGVLACTNGTMVCTGGANGSSELCDGLDNDCDGVTDEGNPGGGASCRNDSTGAELIAADSCRTSLNPADPNATRDRPCGECRFGTLACSAGELRCIGTIGPKLELCDGLDNDCDSPCVIDNSNPSNPIRVCPDDPCKLPQSNPQYLDCDAKIDEGVDATDPNVGEVCSGGSGECRAGIEECVSGVLTCVGGQQGGDEVCNGKDDDCDNVVDEGFALGSSCGVQVGECAQGVTVCNPTGGVTCENAKGPSDERCDGLDNDCDGVIDDGNPEGGNTCGSNVGSCRPGAEKCVGGRLQCFGGVSPIPEVCDCTDNDCDGTVDEDPSSTQPVCAGDAACTMCQCAQPCRAVVEFIGQCPSGKTGVTVDGQCRCVGERCNDVDCGGQTLMAGDEVTCQPGSKTLGSCVCKNNECTSRCNGVVCSGSGLVCDATDGVCKERSCLLAQFACAAGEYCDITTLSCAADSCATTECEATQACRDGSCLGSCANVTCAAGEVCHDGECSPNRCSGVTCTNQVCNPANGECVASGLCVATGCKSGFVCNVVSGECEPDPCLRTTCPQGQVCRTGECEPRCIAPQIDCDALCINPSSSREHCGATGDCRGDNTGVVCTGTQVCSEGQCTDTCALGLINCGGDCVDPNSDALHCGARASCQGLESGQECPSGTICRNARCITLIDSGPSTPSRPDDEYRISTTGGGGCACSVPGRPVDRFPLPSALLVLGVVLTRRRARQLVLRVLAMPRSVVMILGCLWLLWLSACQGVNTLCLNCERDAGSSGDAGSMTTRPDTGTPQPRPDAGARPDSGAGTTDSGIRPDAGGGGRPDAGLGCSDSEMCNGVDDDCDGEVDEGLDPSALGINVQTDANNCGSCGHICRLDHAFSKCEEGQCQVDSCDSEYVDFDGNAATGCEYRCTKIADQDLICDHRDDDCDMKIDDDIDFNSDRLNCGSCGNDCQPANAADGAGTCEDKVCKLDPAQCKPGFVDADGSFATGCEYQCTARNNGAELCNGADDDCDRRIDEGVAGSDPQIGAACGVATGACEEGTNTCASGVVTCRGGSGPSPEMCNGKDDDCDGQTDEADPRRGLPCGLDLGVCTRGNQQCMAGELVCIGGTTGAPEECDGLDNDCDGRTDEVSATDGPPLNVGRTCRTTPQGLEFTQTAQLGACRLGVAECSAGHLSCAGEIGPTLELCDDIDQDCDGQALNGVEITDPLLGTACGTDIGECSFGTYACNVQMQRRFCDNSNGVLPKPEECNGKDDDCDGNYDETSTEGVKPTGAGVRCRVDANGQVVAGANVTVRGECKLGETVCSGGFIACAGYVGPQPELCDALDQDCDGNPTNGVATTDGRIGQACPGAIVGACRPGTQYCNNGTLACAGVIGPSAELCDGIDNDCDGSLADDGADQPGRDAPCGSDVGACRSGTMQCSGGTMQCAGQVIAVAESCDTTDNDCDGVIDEDYQLATNVNRCGSCGNQCSFQNATANCSGGACAIAACSPRFHDSKLNPDRDCQVGPCDIAGAEICNGRDDDCDGETDESLTAPTGVCNVIGACMGAVATCQGASGWVCDKLPTNESCNGRDDNCNGTIDEGYPVGQVCAASDGVGACATSGVFACRPDFSGVSCVDNNGDPVVRGDPTAEICNGRDDDCDGSTDEPCTGGASGSDCVSDDWVALTGGTDIYKFEASRPDATNLTSGAQSSRACSTINRLPWTNLTYDQARAACEAADPNGRLCTEAEWEEACLNIAGSANVCTWGFPDPAATCQTWDGQRCNGVDYMGSATGAQPSGLSGAAAGCYRGPVGTPASQVFELSGNVKEYTLQRDTGAIPVRGGASNNTRDGLRCDFDFPVWPYGSPYVNVGFRCCRNTSALPPLCTTYQTTTTATNNTLAVSTLSVPLAGRTTDVNVVNVRGNHGRMSDVDYIELESPTGTKVRLTNTPYCGSTANWSYVFDSESGTALPPTGTAPCGAGNTYQPAQPLTALNGQNPYGTWTLRVHDTVTASQNPTITSWGVRVCRTP